jgi:hypothetical protein
VLERGPIVATLVEAIRDLSEAAPGFVSLEGEWGSGKSSVVALARLSLRADPDNHVAEVFSGFHFATTDRLVDALASTIERALLDRYATFDAARTFRTYYKTFRPVIAPTLPFGLPDPIEDRRSAKERLEGMLESVQRPIVIFLEDLDRLRGADILTLLGAVQLLGTIRGFVFVLVLDRERCSWQLKDIVPDPDDYLRKSIHVAIPLPEAAPHILGAQFDKMLDAVVEARQVIFEMPIGVSLQREDWFHLAPTMRHQKQLVNIYSTTLKLLGGEINAFDALVANALDQAAPEILDMVAADPWPWLDSLPQPQAIAAAFRYTSRTDRTEERKKALARLSLTRVTLDQAKPFIEALFPDSRSSADAQALQRMSEWEYFRRYRERAVSSAFLPDAIVQSVIRDANAAGSAGAQDLVKGAVLASEGRLALINKLIVRAADLDPGVRLPVILAISAMSHRLQRERNYFEPTESERARALIFQVLELERDDPSKQQAWMDAAIQSSSSLDFADDLVLFATAARNQILTSFSAFDQRRLVTVLTETIRRRIEDGYNPFKDEPKAAPRILAALRDPKAAARHAVSLDGVARVLDSVRPYGLGGDRLDAIQWDQLRAAFDWKILRDGLPKDRDLTTLEQLLQRGPPKSPTTRALPTRCGRLRRSRRVDSKS